MRITEVDAGMAVRLVIGLTLTVLTLAVAAAEADANPTDDERALPCPR